MLACANKHPFPSLPGLRTRPVLAWVRLRGRLRYVHAHFQPNPHVSGLPTALAQERELNRLTAVTHDHQEKLRKVETALETSLGVAFDKTLAPLQLRVEPSESLGILQLVHTPNKVMNKVLLAFSSLCSEVDVLLREAQDIYYPTLVMYGEVVSNEAVGEGVAQVMMGKSLLFLQDLCNYVRRSVASSTAPARRVPNFPARLTIGIFGRGVGAGCTPWCST